MAYKQVSKSVSRPKIINHLSLSFFASFVFFFFKTARVLILCIKDFIKMLISLLFCQLHVSFVNREVNRQHWLRSHLPLWAKTKQIPSKMINFAISDSRESSIRFICIKSEVILTEIFFVCQFAHSTCVHGGLILFIISRSVHTDSG